MIPNVKLILNGQCPHCRETVYTPSSSPTSDATFHFAVALHAAKCSENPEYEESDMRKYVREILGLEES